MSDLDPKIAADILRYGQVRETEPNRPGLLMAKLLRHTRDFINDSPVFGSSDLGNLVFGHAPEAIEDYAYGGKPYRGTGFATQVDPRVLDIAALPLVPGAAVGIGKLMRPKSKMAEALVGEQGVAENEARRNFLKQASALTASSAGGGVIPDIVKTFLKETAPAVVAQGAKTGLSVSAAAALSGGAKFFGEAVGKSVDYPAFQKAWNAIYSANPELKTNVRLREEEYAKFLDSFPKTGKHTKFDNLIDHWNADNGLSKEEQGVWEESLKLFQEHPKSKDLLEKALEGVDPKKLDEDFLARILTWESNPSFREIKGANKYPSDTFHTQRPSLEDPKNLADFEHLILTGELRKGAHPDLPHISLVDLPENSRFKALVDHNLEISGKRSEEYARQSILEHQDWLASPEGKYHEAFMDSPEYEKWSKAPNEGKSLDEVEAEFKKRYKPE